MVNIIIQTKGRRLQLRPEKKVSVTRWGHQLTLAARDVGMADEIWEENQWSPVTNVARENNIIIIETLGKKIVRPSGDSVLVKRCGQLQNMSPCEFESGDQILDAKQWLTVESVCPETQDPRKGGGEDPSCFPASATVTLEDGRRVPIGDVGSGFRVKVMDSFGKRNTSTIYLQTHAKPDVNMDCVSISAGGKTLELSPGHYLFVVSEDGQRRQVTAREVKVGDIILVDDLIPDFRQASVTSVELVERQGMYAPLTLEGSIIVNDVVCSCYTDACRMAPATAHALLWPLRRLWQLSPAGVAVACKPCDLEGRPALAGWFLDNVLSLLPSSSPL